MESAVDLHDWELLSESEPNPHLNPKSPDAELVQHQHPIDHDSEDAGIKLDYFSLDPIKPRQLLQQQQQPEDEIDFGSVDADNPSCLHPYFDSDSDSGSDSRYQSRDQLALSVENSRSLSSDESSARSEVDEGEELGGEDEDEEEKGKGESLGSGEREGERERVWWKMPLEILKLWVIRARPVWSISIAAAIVGVVMLTRRLYKMKQKRRNIPLTIALDDKVKILVHFSLLV